LQNRIANGNEFDAVERRFSDSNAFCEVLIREWLCDVQTPATGVSRSMTSKMCRAARFFMT
jgi:Holliday junction resolvase-like predicted endonuclease